MAPDDWNWLATISARYRSPASCAGSCWAGRLKPSGSLSQIRNAPQQKFARFAKSDYNGRGETRVKV